MGIIPYIVLLCIWFLNIIEVWVFAHVDPVVIALVLYGVYKPYGLVLSVLFGLGILTDAVFNTVFGIHSAVYMVASVLWLSTFYQRYTKYISGYYLIIAGFIIISQLVFGIERYLSLWEPDIVVEYAIKGIYSASLAVFVDAFIPRNTKQIQVS